MGRSAYGRTAGDPRMSPYDGSRPPPRPPDAAVRVVQADRLRQLVEGGAPRRSRPDVRHDLSRLPRAADAVRARGRALSRLQALEPPFRGLRGELPRVEPELLEQRRVLVVVDLLRQLLDRLLHVLVLPSLSELVQDELLVDLHPLSPPSRVRFHRLGCDLSRLPNAKRRAGAALRRPRAASNPS